MWWIYALLSAVFAALTAIFAKVGIEGIDSDFATLIRTVIIVFALTAFVWYAGKWSSLRSLSTKPLFPDALGTRDGRVLGVLLPSAADR